MTLAQQRRFSELLDAQVARGPLLGTERKEYDQLADLWETANEEGRPVDLYRDF